MKYCSFIILCALFSTATAAFAEGLPANPWAAKQEVIDNTVFHASREDIVHSASAPNTNGEYNTVSLQNITASFKKSWEQNKQQHTQTATEDNDVNAVDAVKALDTLSRYMNRNNQGTDNTNNVAVSNGSSLDLSGLKRKFSDFTSQNKNRASAQSSEADEQIRKLRYKYNRYKSEFNSGYNTLKNKTQPLYDTVKNSIREAERATGINF